MLALSNLAAVYSNQGRYDQAEPLFKRGLAVLEKANGPDDPEATVLMSNLADAYIHRHRYADAERLLKRAMAVTEKAYGPDHPDVAQALNNLAALYARQGRNADAERLFKRSVATIEKTLGPNHPDLADVLENLAGSLQGSGSLRRCQASHQAVDGHSREDGVDLNDLDGARGGRVFRFGTIARGPACREPVSSRQILHRPDDTDDAGVYACDLLVQALDRQLRVQYPDHRPAVSAL